MDARTGRETEPLEVLAAGAALVLPLLLVTAFAAPAWSARAAVLLVVAAVGMPILVVRLGTTPSWAVRGAIAFVLAGAASAALSSDHTTALFGLYNQGTGLLFMTAVAGAWAIGTCVREGGRRLVERALLLAGLINAIVALVEAAGYLQHLGVETVTPEAAGQSAALLGNPVHLAALLTGGLALAIDRFVARPRRWAAVLVIIGAGLQVSASRTALVVVAGLLVWAWRRNGIPTVARSAALLAVGLMLGALIAQLGGGLTATERTQRSAGQGNILTTRVGTWWSARHAVAHHPVLGVGPGRFRSATSRYHPVSVARVEGPERLFTDAHDLVVEYLTTTGVLGVGALALWLVAALRRARGPLLAFALAVLALHLVEPQGNVTMPLALLALGAASASSGGGAPGLLAFGPRSPRPGRGRRLQLRVTGGLVVVAVLAGAALLVGDFDLNQARLDFSLSHARRADRLLPAWPVAAGLVSRIYVFQAKTERSPRKAALARHWREIAARRDPTDPTRWNELGELDEDGGLLDRAEVAYERAIRLNPTSARAMSGLARVSAARCQPDVARHWLAASLRLVPVQPGLRRVVEGACAPGPRSGLGRP